MKVDVVLTQDSSDLGKRGEVIKVSSGYAQNFLIPRGKAKIATPSVLKSFEKEKTLQKKREAEALGAAKELARKISESSVTVEAPAGEGEKLYGAVTTQDIQLKLSEQGLAIDKKALQLEEPIKKLGTHQVSVKLHHEVSAKLKVWVVKKK